MAQSPRLSLKSWATFAMVIVAALAVGWLSIMVTMGNLAGPAQSERLLRWFPFNAPLQGRAAYSLLSQTATDPVREKATQFAQTALRRDPSNIPAVRTLGMLALLENDTIKASRLFAYSERLSRRDLATQVWRIEQEVQNGNVMGALKHFDIALRTSKAAPNLLLPVMASAAEDPAILPSVRKLLLGNPPWKHQFVEKLIHRGKSPETMVRLTTGLLSPERQSDRLLANAMIARLTKMGRPDLAYDAYIAAAGHSARADRVRNGSFESENDFPPFDWALTDNEGFAAIRQLRNLSPPDTSLYLISTRGGTGVLARQLLRLEAGSFRLRAVVGGVPADAEKPVLKLSCANEPSRILLNYPWSEAPERGKSIQLHFDVGGANCEMQWLTIEYTTPASTGEASPWIDGVAIDEVV